MSEYGYIPESPEQSFGNNKGIFNPKDIYDLTRADKYTNYGQLELIHTETLSAGTSTIDLKVADGTWDNSYNVHFLTYSNLTIVNGTTGVLAQFFDSTGTIINGTEYHYAVQNCTSNGTFTEHRPPYLPYQAMYLTQTTTNNTSSNREYNQQGYIYIYNANDSSKYTFISNQFTGFRNISGTIHQASNFGSGVHISAETTTGIRFMNFGAQSWDEGTISLYGIKEYS
jgi:archaellin